MVMVMGFIAATVVVYSIYMLGCFPCRLELSLRYITTATHGTQFVAELCCKDFFGLPEVLVRPPFGNGKEVVVGIVDASEGWG